MIHITRNISIHSKEIQLDFVRSQGPGGQNVNKVATAVQLRFDVINSPSLPEDIRNRLIKLSGKRINSNGILVIESKRFRTQERNRHDALEKLKTMINKAAVPPKPRKKTKPTASSKERMLKLKKMRGDIKKLRMPPDHE